VGLQALIDQKFIVGELLRYYQLESNNGVYRNQLKNLWLEESCNKDNMYCNAYKEVLKKI
jgi:hypothetical protein